MADGHVSDDQAKLAQLQRQMEQGRVELKECEKRLQAIQNSWSWRLTRPLRLLGYVARGNFRPIVQVLKGGPTAAMRSEHKDASTGIDIRAPEKHLEQIFEGIEVVPIALSSTARYGEVSLYELWVICAVAKYVKAKRIFEIGTYEGNTTYNLALNTEPQAVIFTLDLPDALQAQQSDLEIVNQYLRGAVTGRRFKCQPQEMKIKQLFGDSSVFDFRPFLHSMDLVFVDGNHAYSYVKSDTQNALRMLTQKGQDKACIIWHDCDPYSDVERVLEEELYQRYYRIAETRMAIYISGMT